MARPMVQGRCGKDRKGPNGVCLVNEFRSKKTFQSLQVQIHHGDMSRPDVKCSSAIHIHVDKHYNSDIH